MPDGFIFVSQGEIITEGLLSTCYELAVSVRLGPTRLKAVKIVKTCARGIQLLRYYQYTAARFSARTF